MINQEKIKEQIMNIDLNLKEFVNENYTKKNKEITFNLELYCLFLEQFKDVEIKKQIFSKIIERYKKEIYIEEMVFGSKIQSEIYSKKELKNKKKLLVKELKKAKKSLKANKIHQKIVSKCKTNTPEEIFYILKKENKNDLYYDKKDTILKYFNYIGKKLKLNIDFNEADLYSDSFYITINSSEKIKIIFKETDYIGEAAGLYSKSERVITIITDKVYKKNKMITLECIVTLSHELGHSIEHLFDKFKNKIKNNQNSEIISMLFERLAYEEFIYEIIKDKQKIDHIEYQNILYEFTTIYTSLKILKYKGKFDIEKIYIRDKDVRIYKSFLDKYFFCVLVFNYKYNYVPFDEYFFGSYYAKRINKKYSSELYNLNFKSE